MEFKTSSAELNTLLMATFNQLLKADKTRELQVLELMKQATFSNTKGKAPAFKQLGAELKPFDKNDFTKKTYDAIRKSSPDSIKEAHQAILTRAEALKAEQAAEAKVKMQAAKAAKNQAKQEAEAKKMVKDYEKYADTASYIKENRDKLFSNSTPEEKKIADIIAHSDLAQAKNVSTAGPKK